MDSQVFVESVLCLHLNVFYTLYSAILITWYNEWGRIVQTFPLKGFGNSERRGKHSFGLDYRIGPTNRKFHNRRNRCCV